MCIKRGRKLLYSHVYTKIFTSREAADYKLLEQEDYDFSAAPVVLVCEKVLHDSDLFTRSEVIRNESGLTI